jgi:predicted NodU family carbamoyl transferase
MNGMIFDRSDFRDVYVQPAAHDAGTSIGAALYVASRLSFHVLLQCDMFTMGRNIPTVRSLLNSKQDANIKLEKPFSSLAQSKRSRMERSSAGFRAAWNLARVLSGTEASSRILVVPT